MFKNFMVNHKEKEYTFKELADEVGVSYRTILREIKRRRIKTKWKGMRKVVTESALRSYEDGTSVR